MPEFSSIFHRPRRLAIVAASALAALAAAGAWWLTRERAAGDPALLTPRLAIEAISAEALYYNGPARPWLVVARPDLLAPDDRAAPGARARDYAQAVLEVPFFRKLDRRDRFDTLLLVGDPSGYRALLDHLVETKDFTLTYVDHTSLVFHRGAREPWNLSKLAAVRARFADRGPRERADFLAEVAVKLTAAHREHDAGSLLDEALAIDAKSPEVWSAFAGYHVSRGDFADALAAADRALRLDARHLGALAARTQVLYATKRYNEALALSDRLLALLPEDPNVLFKHAQIAHEAHAYRVEIRVLEKLIALAEADRRSTTGYRLYLAQAYTAAGQGQPAIDQFQRVLADPELPDDQRKFALESLTRIKSRTGL